MSRDVDLLGDESNVGAMDIVRDMVRFRQHPFKFADMVLKYLWGSSWRAYDPYIGAKLFGSYWADRMRSLILSDPVLQSTVAGIIATRMQEESDWTWTAEERENRELMYKQWIEAMVLRIFNKAMPIYEHHRVLRAFYFMTGQVLSRGYHQGVHISRDDIARVRSKAAELSEKKQSLLLFPCHKSHMDYTVLVFAFYRMGLSLPATIAGDNLDIVLINRLLREVGATFIRRGNWNVDPLYVAFFQSLINSYLGEGQNFQCFIEGTRSRTGKLLPPKFGILKYVLASILSGRVDDAWVLPVSTQYDKVFEADSYVSELLGTEKKSESIWGFLESSQFLSLRLGRVDIRFGEIWSLREYVVDYLVNADIIRGPPSSLKLLGSIPDAVKLHLLRSLGYRILGDINKCSVVMPSALLGTVLLTTKDRGLSKHRMVKRAQDLVQRIVRAGGRIGAISKPASELSETDICSILDNAVRVLGPDLVEVEIKGVLEPVYRPRDDFKLSYYRNQVAHLFVSEAIVCLALYTLAKQETSFDVPLKELERKVRFLSVLMSGEFVFKPEGLDTNLTRTLAKLEDERICTTSTISGEVHVQLTNPEADNNLVTLDFYCYLVWPFIDGYLSVAYSLFVMPTRGGPVTEKQFVSTAHSVARTLYAQGELMHSEALNREVIKFALDHYASQGIIRRWRSADKIMWLELVPQYKPKSQNGKPLFQGPLYELAAEISLSQNKQTRYRSQQSIASRVLELCIPVAQALSPRL